MAAVAPPVQPPVEPVAAAAEAAEPAEAAEAAPNPPAQPPSGMALVLSKYQTFWTKQVEENGQVLFCQNPKCAHMFDRNVDGGFTYTCKPCDQTVEVEVQGEKVMRYRFQEDDKIFLGCRGCKVDEGGSEEHIQGCTVCEECHYASPVPMHQGMTQECLCCADAGVNQAANPNGAPRRSRQHKPRSKADEFGPQLVQLETINRSTYASAAKIEEIKEESNELLRAHETEGGAAQRRAEMARRRAERRAANDKARKELDAQQKALIDKELEEQERLDRMRAGIFLDPDDEDESIEVSEEDAEAAAALFGEDRESVTALRAAFPDCALRWLGPEPTEEQIEAQLAIVKDAQEAKEAATARYQLALREHEALDEEAGVAGQDYEDAEDQPPQRKNARKKVSEMNEVELAEHQRKQADAKKKRDETNADKKKKLEDYPTLLKKAEKYEKAKVLISEQESKIEVLNETLEQNKRATEKKEATFREEKGAFLDWLGRPEGKPPGWDASAAKKAWRAHVASSNAKRQGEPLAQPAKKSARRNAPADSDADEAGAA